MLPIVFSVTCRAWHETEIYRSGPLPSVRSTRSIDTFSIPENHRLSPLTCPDCGESIVLASVWQGSRLLKRMSRDELAERYEVNFRLRSPGVPPVYVVWQMTRNSGGLVAAFPDKDRAVEFAHAHAYEVLEKSGKRGRLRVYEYVGQEMTRTVVEFLSVVDGEDRKSYWTRSLEYERVP